MQLGLITVSTNGLDASDRDSAINIRPWPIKGMFQPDAIAAYKVGAQTYLVTANEGDTREYTTFVEAVRLGSGAVTLDPTVFPNASALKNNAALGRLNITSQLGRDPTTGMYRELYAFGGRSISIWNTQGALVYDSRDELETFTALLFPANFNASNTNNDFDNRSDDKGPEPEGVVIGKVFGRDYAFVGLERIGGIIAYDITDPTKPFLATYSNPRNFAAAPGTPEAGDLGPEGLIFITAEESPNGKPLLVVGNEISGTTTIYEIGKLD